MPNHVHLILVPSDPDGLRHALARVHRTYAGIIQARRKRRGHSWQGRFGAVAMDEPHLAAALRYVSLNPVRARLVERAQDWHWSSTRAHLRGKDDGVTALTPIRDRFPEFADHLESEPETDLFDRLRAAESVGRSLGDDRFSRRPPHSRHQQRHRVSPPARQAETRRLRTEGKAAASRGADFYVPHGGVCRHPLLLAVAARPTPISRPRDIFRFSFQRAGDVLVATPSLRAVGSSQ